MHQSAGTHARNPPAGLLEERFSRLPSVAGVVAVLGGLGDVLLLRHLLQSRRQNVPACSSGTSAGPLLAAASDATLSPPSALVGL